LRFHVNFRMNFSISAYYTAGILKGIALDLHVNCFG
jgi:hypothetical protein